MLSFPFFSSFELHIDPEDRPTKAISSSSASSFKKFKKSPPRHKNSKPSRRWKRRLFLWGLNSVVWLGIILFSIGVWFSYDLPDIRRLESITRRPSITLLTRSGTVLATYGDVYGSFTPAHDLPPHVPAAIIAIEDHRFFSHFGIDLFGIIRAAWTNYRAGTVVQGGSTLTQQLAKNFLLSEKLYKMTDRSIRRKIQEILLALWLERKFTKTQILTIYLNRMYLGAGVYGIQAAAYKYFGKDASQLSIYEAAIIAGLLKAPSRYSPLSNPTLANQRAQVVLTTMQEEGFISAAQRDAFRDSFPSLTPLSTAIGGRYFADWIVETLDEYIGLVEEDIIVQTTYDERLQKIAEEEAHFILEKEGKTLNISQTALVAMTPDGGVRAMVGGKNYLQSQFNRATQAYRQMGSAFKYFTFLCALEKGKHPHSLVKDTPLRIGKWQASNYKYKARGEVSLVDGFAYSGNGAAVRLAYEAGLKRLKEMVRRLGVKTPQPNDMTIALGSGETNLLELTAAYAVVANHGFSVLPYGIVEIKEAQAKKVLYKRRMQGTERALSSRQVLHMIELLQASFTYGTGKAAFIDRPCVGKTGTSQKYRNAWCIGFTADLVGGVWMGNDNGESMKQVTGGKTPAQLWHNFMFKAHEGYGVHAFPQPIS